MATILTLVGAANAADQSSYTTNSFSPMAGDFLICHVSASGTVTNGTVSDTAGLGWTLIGSVNDGTNIVVMFYAQRTTNTDSMTVTWDCSADPATGARVGIAAVRGSDATVRQFATNTGGAGTTPSVTFSQAFMTNNAGLGQVTNTSNPATITPSTGWTEAADAGWGPPTTGFEIQRVNSGETNTTLNWGSTSATAWIAMAVEFWDINDAPGAQPHNYIDAYYGVSI